MPRLRYRGQLCGRCGSCDANSGLDQAPLDRGASRRIGTCPLLLNRDATPEGYVILDVAGGGLGIGVIPGGVGILLPIDQQRVVAGLSLPGAARGRGTGAEILTVE